MCEGVTFMDYLAEISPEALTMDGYEDCIIGVCERFGTPPIVLYDKQKVIDNLRADGMSVESAEEWYEYNMLGSWMGDGTPAFLITRIDES